jgi:hypothetical protein
VGGKVVGRRELTFEQVKQVGEFAWHPDGYIYNGRLLRIVCLAATGGNVKTAQVRPSAMQGTEPLIRQGWRHLDDCTCGICDEQIPRQSNGGR